MTPVSKRPAGPCIKKASPAAALRRRPLPHAQPFAQLGPFGSWPRIPCIPWRVVADLPALARRGAKKTRSAVGSRLLLRALPYMRSLHQRCSRRQRRKRRRPGSRACGGRCHGVHKGVAARGCAQQRRRNGRRGSRQRIVQCREVGALCLREAGVHHHLRVGLAAHEVVAARRRRTRHTLLHWHFGALAHGAPGHAIHLDVAGDAQEGIQARRRGGARHDNCRTYGVGPQVRIRRRKGGRQPRKAGVVAVDAAPARAQAAACSRASAHATSTATAAAPALRRAERRTQAHLVAILLLVGHEMAAEATPRAASAASAHALLLIRAMEAGRACKWCTPRTMGTDARIAAFPNALQRCAALMR